MDCKYEPWCGAPLCPLEIKVREAFWYSGEEHCHREDLVLKYDWLSKQSKIARTKGCKDECFNVNMLEVLQQEDINRTLRGMDMDESNDKSWIRDYKLGNRRVKRVIKLEEKPNPDELPKDFHPQSIRILQLLKDDKKKALEQQVVEENKILPAGSPQKTLNDIIKENYGLAPYIKGDEYYIDAHTGCVVYFYRKDPSGLFGWWGGKEPVAAFQVFRSTPNFDSFASTDELNNITQIRLSKSSLWDPNPN